MKRLAFFLLLAASAFGQGAFIPPQTAFRVVNGLTSPIANATITVCPALAAGIPCAPVTVSIFKDVALSQPLSNPFTADAQGNYQFAVAQGTYTVTVTAFGFNGYSYQVSVSSAAPVPGPGSGSATPGSAFPLRFTYTFGRGDGILAYGHGVGAVGTQGNFSPTATETSGRTVSSSAVGSTNTVVSTCSGMGANPGQDFLSFGTIARFTTRLETQTTATARYWVGIMDLGAGECTSGNSTYTSDTPNRNYCAFRFSTTTDTTWKAVCATSNVAQTVVDTGVTPVTSASTVFEVFPNAAATTFYINGTLVATVSTNLPPASSPVSFGFQGDNKNTATAETVVFFWDELLEAK